MKREGVSETPPRIGETRNSGHVLTTVARQRHIWLDDRIKRRTIVAVLSLDVDNVRRDARPRVELVDVVAAERIDRILPLHALNVLTGGLAVSTSGLMWPLVVQSPPTQRAMNNIPETRSSECPAVALPTSEDILLESCRTAMRSTQRWTAGNSRKRITSRPINKSASNRAYVQADTGCVYN